MPRSQGLPALAALPVLRLPKWTYLSSLSNPIAGNAGLSIVFFAIAETGPAIGAPIFHNRAGSIHNCSRLRRRFDRAAQRDHGPGDADPARVGASAAEGPRYRMLALLAGVWPAVGIATGLTLGAIFLLSVIPISLNSCLTAELFGRNAKPLAGIAVNSPF